MIKGDGILAHRLPFSVISRLLRHGGNGKAGKRLSIFTGNAARQSVISDIRQSKFPEFFRDVFFCHEAFIGNGLGLSRVADSVNAGASILHKPVA